MKASPRHCKDKQYIPHSSCPATSKKALSEQVRVREPLGPALEGIPGGILQWRAQLLSRTVLRPQQIWALWRTPAPPSPPRDTSTVDGCGLTQVHRRGHGRLSCRARFSAASANGKYWVWDRASGTTRTAGGKAALQQGSYQQNAHQCSWGMADGNERYKQSFQNLPGVENLFAPFFAMHIQQYTIIHSIAW